MADPPLAAVVMKMLLSPLPFSLRTPGVMLPVERLSRQSEQRFVDNNASALSSPLWICS